MGREAQPLLMERSQFPRERRVARLRQLGVFVGTSAVGVVCLASFQAPRPDMVADMHDSGGAAAYCASEAGDECRGATSLCGPDSLRGTFGALCAGSCDGADWSATCAWQAAAGIESVCRGTFAPVAPSRVVAEGEDDCEARAFCDSCADGGCEAVLGRGGPRTSAAAAAAALNDDLEGLCAASGYELSWRAPVGVGDDVVSASWESVSTYADAEVVDVEEHFLYGDDWLTSQTFVKQAYAYWRYALNGRRAATRPGAPTVRATTRSYGSVAARRGALDRSELGNGALVFVDVMFQAMDTEHAACDGDSVLADGGLPRSVVGAKDARTDVDFLCAYAHAEDLLLRSSLLRAIVSYERPLVVVLSGDADCRLSTLPTSTHHTFVFPNDGACASQVDGLGDKRLWWPEGLEGLDARRDSGPLAAQRGFGADAGALVDGPSKPLEERPFLLDLSFTVTPRKPSRVALLDYLETGGGREALLALSDAAGRRTRVAAASTVRGPEATTYGFDSRDAAEATPGGDPDAQGDAAAVFALAPAGDTWSSGRVVEAMLRGAVPVVDATYATDGVSAKGCADAASFWRRGSDAFPRAAPFVFVDDWADLPRALRDFGATDDDALRARLDAVADYRDDLETALRDATLDAVARARRADPTDATACVTEPLSDDDARRFDAATRAYYSDPDWYHNFQDAPSFPGSGCTTAYFTDGRKQHGALCFDAACAPPLVKAFTCGPKGP